MDIGVFRVIRDNKRSVSCFFSKLIFSIESRAALGAPPSRLMPHSFCTKHTYLYPELRMIGLGAPASRRLTFPYYNRCSPITTQQPQRFG
jgi:hypothetical protein